MTETILNLIWLFTPGMLILAIFLLAKISKKSDLLSVSIMRLRFVILIGFYFAWFFTREDFVFDFEDYLFTSSMPLALLLGIFLGAVLFMLSFHFFKLPVFCGGKNPIAIFVFVALIPLGEELLFRASIFNWFYELPSWKVIIVSTLAWSLWRFCPSKEWLGAVIGGLIFCIISAFTQQIITSLLAQIIFHSLIVYNQHKKNME